MLNATFWAIFKHCVNDEGILFLPINCPKVIMYYQDTQKLQIQRPEKKLQSYKKSQQTKDEKESFLIVSQS